MNMTNEDMALAAQILNGAAPYIGDEAKHDSLKRVAAWLSECACDDIKRAAIARADTIHEQQVKDWREVIDRAKGNDQEEQASS